MAQTVTLGAIPAIKRLIQAPIPPIITTARSPIRCTTKWLGRAVTQKREAYYSLESIAYILRQSTAYVCNYGQGKPEYLMPAQPPRSNAVTSEIMQEFPYCQG